MAATKLKGKLAIAGAVSDMAGGTSPEQALNSMLESLAKRLFDIEGVKQQITDKINDKLAELPAKVQQRADAAAAAEKAAAEKAAAAKAAAEKAAAEKAAAEAAAASAAAAEKAAALEEMKKAFEKMKEEKENLEKMYDELTEKMQTISKALSAMFDLVAALKPPDELISMFGKGVGDAFDEDLGMFGNGEEMQEKLEELINKVTNGMVTQLNGVQAGVGSMVANLKSYIEKMPVDFFNVDAPDVNLLCPFPKFSVTGVAVPTMMDLSHTQALLMGPCSDLRKMLQDACCNPNLAGPMRDLLKSLTDASGLDPLSGANLIPKYMRERIAEAMGQAAIGSLGNIASDILGDLMMTAIIGSNPVTSILQGIRKSYRSAKKSYAAANKLYKAGKKRLATAMQKKIKNQMSQKMQAVASGNLREIREYYRLAKTLPPQFLADVRSLKEAVSSDKDFYSFSREGTAFKLVSLSQKGAKGADELKPVKAQKLLSDLLNKHGNRYNKSDVGAKANEDKIIIKLELPTFAKSFIPIDKLVGQKKK